MTAIVATVAALLALNNSALRTYDPVASAAGLPKLTSFIADPASPPGWEASYVTEYTANKPLFGESSVWYRYGYGEAANHQPGRLTSSLPVTADVINAGGLSGFAQYGVTACYSFHGYELRDVAKVALGNGINGQAMSWSSQDGFQDWTVVYWIWPVKMASGTRYERIILYLQNTEDSKVVMPAGVSGISGLKGALKATSPADRQLIVNRGFLVEFARQLISAQTRKVDTQATLDSVIEAHQYPATGTVTGSGVSVARARANRERFEREVAGHRRAVQEAQAASASHNGSGRSSVAAGK